MAIGYLISNIARSSIPALFFNITQLLAMVLRINLEIMPNNAVNNISPKCCQYPTGKGALRFALLESARGCSKASWRPVLTNMPVFPSIWRSESFSENLRASP
jgi:hypothetical protein